jgi:hypothetical protein
MVCDTGKNVGKSGLRIDMVHFCCDNQTVHGGGPLTTAVGTSKQPSPPPESHLPDILPISGKKSRSITAGMRFMVGMSGVTTASSAADRKLSLSSTNPE